MSKPLVIVESPTKRDTIKKFLGGDYLVEASVGHIRDLPEGSKELSDEDKKVFGEMAVNIEDDFRPLYVVPPRKKAQVTELRALLKQASALYLATDEDREGESISWHLREVLKPKVPTKRMVFHEITPEAIREALQNPRDIDEHLVAAQETRRVVDRLYGYAVSPVLWRKIKGARSAGRVQSPAVRLLVERERARMAFVASTWWDLEAQLVAGSRFGATLHSVGGRRIARGKDFDETTGALANADVLLLGEAAAAEIAARTRGAEACVASVESKPWRERPYPPFTTSTIQQEANRKFRWTAAHTMRVAQDLYESGWITYMRTDSVALSEQAIGAARAAIAAMYGPDFLPSSPRRYTSKSKNAQEAHEAIRPAGSSFRSIDQARAELTSDASRLYELVWKRTVACQMNEAHGDQVTVLVDIGDARFSAGGRTIAFPGFMRAYVEGSDDPDAELAGREKLLPRLDVGQAVSVESIEAKGHTTQPPARLTEASLVKELERLGIGRPSTYAAIIKVILDRGYAFKKGNALVPTYTAFLVTTFMEQRLGDLVSYDFTARIEDELDGVASGTDSRSRVLRDFYLGDGGLRSRLDAALSAENGDIYRLPVAGPPGHPFHVRVGPYGAFATDGATTVNIPSDMPPDEVTGAWLHVQAEQKAAGPKQLGTDPDGTPIFLAVGRFGPYVQRGAAVEGAKPPRASLAPGMTPDSVTLSEALQLLALPRVLGREGEHEIQATLGRYGPYVRRGTESRSIPEGMSVLTLTLADAQALLAAPAQRARRGGVSELKILGAAAGGASVRLMNGRFGPYVTDGTTNATVPRGRAPESLSLEEAVDLLAARAARLAEEGGAPRRGKKRAGRGAGKAAAKAAARANGAGNASAAGKGKKGGGVRKKG